VRDTERRHSRRAPQARLRPGGSGFPPELTPGIWYNLETTQPPQPCYVWLRTPHGAVAWQRGDLELRDGARKVVQEAGPQH
jgi:hypothetical protein